MINYIKGGDWLSIYKKNSLYFVSGFLVVLLFLPLLSIMGVPSFNVVLTELFGEGNPLAIVFSLVIIAAVLLMMHFVVNKKTRSH